MLTIVLHVSQVILLSFASHSVGQFLRKWSLPIISGYLLTGILSGPYVLVMISGEATASLRMLDELALSCIAFAAGSELHLQELRAHSRAILYTLAALMTATFTLLFTTMLIFTEVSGMFRSLPGYGRLAVCLLTSTVLMARSPASAIAVVKELRASGPFTTIALSVSVAMDVVLIMLFSVNVDVAHTLLAGMEFHSIASVVMPFGKLITSFLVGLLVGKLLEFTTASRMPLAGKSFLMVFYGFTVFFMAETLRERTSSIIDIEPLLACVLASVLATNITTHRDEYQAMLDMVLPRANIVFFTLAGASLAINTLVDTYWLAMMLFVVRLCALWIGTQVGGYMASLPQDHSRIRWMAFVTQAGVAMGLARQVSLIFPTWGPSFASMVISVVVLNEMLGPPLFRYSLVRTGEAKAFEPSDGPELKSVIADK
mmetsp:Transcript_54603/g.90074  ORF Transcript_54603/g.90074 Transcript_54603/m.90074 type:complete len:429 (+) Transcript_54603:130-1416(+)|eukprot:CAMPEP_0174386052 /NCGR_PEP_ID=MMETSP0811_2-20130205/127015_1 /TAXON_ID=73025 ORGANISM="Eutreptiella gymnastica-like, Strain CCMP1594" /NCGR_SAMPLE_ID=MMETSP0811_2 /ASSEMBLY_ACC=CAM_ASM_000667 /LENGTH=428 /DNA_ID=CAMNT_0015540587 /DNA_START=130 /DNA_END=1416 /DNA_ORIENTATION=+